MKTLYTRFAAVLALVGLTVSITPVLAGEEPVQTDSRDAQEMIDNALKYSMDQYKRRVIDCRAFGGFMDTPDTCKVDNSQLYYCNTMKTSVIGKCFADKVVQTIVHVNGLAIGQPLKPVWKERNGGGSKTKPHGVVPEPSSIVILVIGFSLMMFSRNKKS